MATAKRKSKETSDDRTSTLGVPASMKPEIVSFRVVGISPLLQNNPANFIGSKPESALATKKDYKDKEETELRLYKEDDGTFYHPTQAFIKSMLRAVTGKKFGKISAPGILRSSVFICEPHTTILDSKGNQATEYSIDRQPVVIGTARILRCRPCWPEWKMDVSLDIDIAMIGKDQIREALSLAGRTVGIGDYRPEKGGGFGRFRIE